MRKERGFTIIELLIATTVFSLVLLITMAGILEVTRMYYRGVTQSRTQEISRNIVDEISESIRYSNATVAFEPSVDGGNGRLRLGGKMYTFTIGKQLQPNPDVGSDTQSSHVLWYQEGAEEDTEVDLESDNPCDGIDTQLCQSPRELLVENMRLGAFSVEREDEAGQEIYRISLSVVYGADDLLDVNESNTFPYTCRSVNRGSEYCAVSNLSVIVNRRLQ